MLISEIENIIKEVFREEEGVIKSVGTVYEKTEDGNFLNLVISIHKLSIEDTLIIHTKFIFKTDIVKVNIMENSFNYLYDINCVYRKVNFSDINDLKNKLEKIIESNNFGKDIQELSSFIDAPATLITDYFGKNNITKYNVDNVEYKPKAPMTPCKETTFDFEINVNNIYDVSLCVSKDNEHGKNIYKFKFTLLDNTEVVEVDSLTRIEYLIGGKLIEMLDKISK
jgi:hypothetical protein